MRLRTTTLVGVLVFPQAIEADSQRLRRRLQIGRQNVVHEARLEADHRQRPGLGSAHSTWRFLGCGQFPVHVSPAEAQRRLEHVRPLLQDVEG